MFFYQKYLIAFINMMLFLPISAMDCSKYPELCKKRFNEVAQLFTHNATSYAFSPVQNQELTIPQQLSVGVTGFKIPVHLSLTNQLNFYYLLLNKRATDIERELKSATNIQTIKLKAEQLAIKSALSILSTLGASDSQRIPYACHALPKGELYGNYGNDLINAMPDKIKPLLIPYKETLNTAYLSLIKTTLGESDQSKVEGAGGAIPWTPCLLDRSAQPLRTFLGEIKNHLEKNPGAILTIIIDNYINDYDAIKKEFEVAGLLSYLYKQPEKDRWPTLEDLTKQGKRLIVFLEKPRAGDILDKNELNWANKFSTFRADSEYNFKTTNDLIQKSQEDARFQIYGKDNANNNKVAYVHHYVTPLISGSKKDALIANTAKIVEPRLKKIIEYSKLMPWLSVDFMTNNYELVDVIKRINGLDKYTGAPKIVFPGLPKR